MQYGGGLRQPVYLHNIRGTRTGYVINKFVFHTAWENSRGYTWQLYLSKYKVFLGKVAFSRATDSTLGEFTRQLFVVK